MKLINSYKIGRDLLTKFIEEEEKEKKTEILARKIADIFNAKNKILICGNGGSNADSIHFAEEFTGRFRKERRPLPVISISDSSHITCVANDYGYDYVFSKGVEAYGQPGDMLIGLTTSGNSKNITKAIEVAKKMGLYTCAFLGKDGGSLKGEADFEFLIPGKTSDRIQEIHMMILHILIEGVEKILFPENYIE